ncbi:MAG: hypothetical protein BWY28_00443 [bacterium ADurb.Bin236]|nr:MAG: hypothetical protein BWY28_00443 [bacterium ADurb.Bin236]HPN94389.1 hypothetical protein [bacterium]
MAEDNDNVVEQDIAEGAPAKKQPPVPMESETLRSVTFLAAALPLIEEIVASDAALQKKVSGWNCAIQFKVKNDIPAAYVLFEKGAVSVVQGTHDKPVITMTFKNCADMNGFFTGKMILPKISGMSHLIILMTFLMKMMMKMKMLMPEYKCKTEEEKLLKVRMMLYMVAFALQEMSRGGDDYIYRLTKTARKKIIEWTVNQEEPAVHVRIDEGDIKATKGKTKRRPYVGMDFKDLDAALKVLSSEVGALDATRQQLVSFRGTAEYGIKVGNLMTRVGNLLMPVEEEK